MQQENTIYQESTDREYLILGHETLFYIHNEERYPNRDEYVWDSAARRAHAIHSPSQFLNKSKDKTATFCVDYVVYIRERIPSRWTQCVVQHEPILVVNDVSVKE
jgi:hypothetical protein